MTPHNQIKEALEAIYRVRAILSVLHEGRDPLMSATIASVNLCVAADLDIAISLLTAQETAEPASKVEAYAYEVGEQIWKPEAAKCMMAVFPELPVKELYTTPQPLPANVVQQPEQAQELSDGNLDKALSDLHNMAMDYSPTDYGLPLHDEEEVEKMRKIVRSLMGKTS